MFGLSQSSCRESYKVHHMSSLSSSIQVLCDILFTAMVHSNAQCPNDFKCILISQIIYFDYLAFSGPRPKLPLGILIYVLETILIKLLYQLPPAIITDIPTTRQLNIIYHISGKFYMNPKIPFLPVTFTRHPIPWPWTLHQCSVWATQKSCRKK